MVWSIGRHGLHHLFTCTTGIPMQHQACRAADMHVNFRN